MYFTKLPEIFTNVFFHDVVTRFTTDKNEIFLTFDDGPHPEITPAVLETLEKSNIKATFFCIGKNIEKYPELYAEIKKCGHTIGNHSYSHPNGWKTETDEYLLDVEKCNRLVASKLFRPPYGKITFSQYKQLHRNYKIIFWSVMSGDFNNKIQPDVCLNKTIKQTKKGSIIVFHDNLQAKNTLLHVLPAFIKHFSEKSFNFKTL